MVVDSVDEGHFPEVDITFKKADLRDVVPHENDPVVISLITTGRRVHRVLVDQGSSADVMFWSTFNNVHRWNNSPHRKDKVLGGESPFCVQHLAGKANTQ